MASHIELPAGIASLRGWKDDPSLPGTDLHLLTTQCFTAARTLRGRVLQKPTWDMTTNFAAAVLKFESQVIVLVNVIHPVVGFAMPPEHDFHRFGPYNFIDCEPLAAALSLPADYRIASCEELERPVLKEYLGRLSPPELERARYFRPRRVGDIIFNAWN